MVGKIEKFEDLVAWQESQSLAVEVYTLTRLFPKDELFGITSQLRRAVSSISANIAEGFGRQTPADKINFYTIAYGSLLETKNFLYLSEKLDYISSNDLSPLIEHVISCQRLINASKKSLRHG